MASMDPMASIEAASTASMEAASMASMVQALRACRAQVAALQQRVDDLEVENRDLRAICVAHGIWHEETLAANRHRRYFARLRREHPAEGAVRYSFRYK